MTEKQPEYPLHSIYFYPTESCNLKCIHCWIKPDHVSDKRTFQKVNRDNITVKTMERIIKDAIPLGLRHIKITGGEPFLHPDIFDYLDCFHMHGLSLSFETNGTLLTKDFLIRLKEYDVKLISISLDGSTPEMHERIRGVKSCFDKAINGIKLIVENGIFPEVIFCLMKMNAHDLENTIDLAYQLGAGSFEINPIALLGENGNLKKNPEGLSIQELLDLEKRVENELLDRYQEMPVDLYLPPALKGIKELSRSGLCACNIHNICGILSNGDVSMCGIGRRDRNLIMGNIKSESIAQIWEQGVLFNEIREKVPKKLEGICGKCLFKNHCLGFCRADILFEGKGLPASHGLCEMVYQMGLFPESRILD